MGGAVQLYGVAAAEITGGLFDECEAGSSNGGGVGYFVHADSSPAVLIEGAAFTSNTALKGGAIGSLSYYRKQGGKYRGGWGEWGRGVW